MPRTVRSSQLELLSALRHAPSVTLDTGRPSQRTGTVYVPAEVHALCDRWANLHVTAATDTSWVGYGHFLGLEGARVRRVERYYPEDVTPALPGHTRFLVTWPGSLVPSIVDVAESAAMVSA